jgi:hypothetical protein
MMGDAKLAGKMPALQGLLKAMAVPGKLSIALH